MALPDPAFEDFLAGARVVAEEPASGPRELVRRSPGSGLRPGYEVWLAYPSGALQLDSVLKKVGEGLTAVGAPSSRSIALAVLVLIVGTKGTTGHVEHANQLLREVRQAELSFNFVSPTPPPTADVRADYGAIKVEPFDPARLEYWAERGGSRWPIAPRDVRGRAAFVSRMRGVTLINTDRLPGAERLFKNWPGDAIILLDPYFQSVTDALLDHLKTDTAQRLGLVEAAGIAAFDFSSMVNWSWGIHLFTWPSSRESSAGSWAIFQNTPPAKTLQDARHWY